MKCKVLFDFPIGFNNQPTPSESVIVDFPVLPRRGDRVSKNDENFAPLMLKIAEYFASVRGLNVMDIEFNVVKFIVYQNGEQTVVVGNDPDKLVMYGGMPGGDGCILTSTKVLPRIGDAICGREWYVESVNIVNKEAIQVGVSDDPIEDEEED